MANGDAGIKFYLFAHLYSKSLWLNVHWCLLLLMWPI